MLRLLPDYQELPPRLSLSSAEPASSLSSLSAREIVLESPEHIDESPQGICVAFSTYRHGYMYDLLKERQIAHMPFPNPVKGAETDGMFLYTYGDSGLDIWTLRSSRLIKKHSPESCILGMSPFIGLQEVCTVGSEVVALSKIVDTTKKKAVQKSGSSSVGAVAEGDGGKKKGGALNDNSGSQGSKGLLRFFSFGGKDKGKDKAKPKVRDDS